MHYLRFIGGIVSKSHRELHQIASMSREYFAWDNYLKIKNPRRFQIGRD